MDLRYLLSLEVEYQFKTSIGGYKDVSSKGSFNTFILLYKLKVF